MTINNCSELLTRIQSQVNNICAQNITWKQTSTGFDHTVGLKSDGTIWTWGRNTSAGLGDGTLVNRSSPGTIVGGGTTWCQVSAGGYHSAAIKTDGTLWTWGNNNQGRLGDGTTTRRCSPGTIAGGGTTWCLIAAGAYHTAAIKTDGTLWTWGTGACGRLGEGTTTDRCSPGTVWGSYTTWCQISCGSMFHSSAVKTDGTLWTWGFNVNGQLGDGTTTDRCSPGTIAGGGTNWCSVSGIRCHTGAIKTDGTVWTWGRNASGQLGDGTIVSRCSPGTIAGGGTWCRLSNGSSHSAAIKYDGTVWTWGFNACGRLGEGTTTDRCSPGTIAGAGTNWCQLSGARYHGAAVKIDGTLWTWGNNTCGKLGNNSIQDRCSPGSIAIQLASTPKEITLLSVAASQVTDNRQVSVASSNELPDIRGNNISNGQMIFLEDRLIPVIANNECWLGLDGRVLRSDAPTRTLFTWGDNVDAVLGDGTTVDRCSPGTTSGCGSTWCLVSAGDRNGSAIKTDGTLWTWGSDSGLLGINQGAGAQRSSPGTTSGNRCDWCYVAFGTNALAIRCDGTLWHWGGLPTGESGGTTFNVPTKVGSSNLWCDADVSTILATERFAAIKTDGTLWTWGRNALGELGDGTTLWRCSPGTTAGGGANWCKVRIGARHMAAIKTDGTLWTWGCNCLGWLGDGTIVNRCSPGTTWGSYTNWCDISAGQSNTAAIKTDGTLWTWGRGTTGALGNGTTVNRCSPGTIWGGGTNWCKINAGARYFMSAIKTDGTLWTWGRGNSGYLGSGNLVCRCSPGTIAGGGTNWFQVSSRERSTLAIQVQ